MNITRIVDRLRPPTAELEAARQSYLELWLHSYAEEAAGVMEETPDFLRLNRAVNDAVEGRGRWFDWRAAAGADALYDGRA